MNFVESIKTCFRKYFVFKGRASRSEFWWFQLFLTIATYAAMALDHLLLGYTWEDVATPLAMIAAIVIIVPSTAVTARRLHDIGWSGWVQLPVFLTYTAYLDVWFSDFSASTVGTTLMAMGMLTWFGLLIILIKDSHSLTNKYGPNPKSPDMGGIFG